MERLALGTVALKPSGIIIAAEGVAGGVALKADIVGRSWGDVFGDWGLPRALPENPGAYPIRFRGVSPKGEPVCTDLTMLSLDANPTILAILRSDEVSSLPPRLQRLCAIGEVSCCVCHEIKNALTAPLGYLQMFDKAGRQLSPDEIRTIHEELQRIADLAHSLHEVAQDDLKPPQPLDLRKLLNDVAMLVRHEMGKGDIAFDTQIDPDLPTVVGRAGQLKQALINLLVNAQQATPSGGRVTLAASGEQNGKVRISVEDTGCGIPLELHSRVFRSFFSTKADGTGLGLPITRQIVEQHGGTIQMESAPGRGTRFTIRLPAGMTQ